MKYFDICTSKKVSQELLDMGLGEPTCFYWHFDDLKYSEIPTAGIPAYTLQSILKFLPAEVKGASIFLGVEGEVSEISLVGYPDIFYAHGRHLPDVAAKVLIWCLQNKYVETKTERTSKVSL